MILSREFKNLSQILMRERDAIIAADFSGLAKISKAKERALSSVRLQKLTAQQLGAVQNEIQVNSDFLASSARGIAQARATLSKLRSPKKLLQTYEHRAGGTIEKVRR